MVQCVQAPAAVAMLASQLNMVIACPAKQGMLHQLSSKAVRTVKRPRTPAALTMDCAACSTFLYTPACMGFQCAPGR